jgi:outer membrane protein assembly factor BamE (lipoprotein component of BamABCDE complex)
MVGRIGACCVAVMLGISACAQRDASSFRPGVSREEVVKLAGQPDLTLTNATDMNLYLFHARCPSKDDSKQVLVYKRWFRSDLAIAFDGREQVVCAWYADVTEIVR